MGKYFLKSLYLHLLIVLLIYFFGQSYFKIWDWGKKEKILTGSSSIRVDIVAMPKLTLREQRNLKIVPLNEAAPSPTTPLKGKETEKNEPAPAKKTEAKKDDYKSDPTDLEIQGKEKKGKLEDLLKDISKKELKTAGNVGEKGLEKEHKNKESIKGKGGEGKDSLSPSLAKEFKNLIFAGNKLSKGTSAIGNGENSEVTEFTLYIETILAQIRPYWKLPGYLAEKNLTCRVRIFISREGRILNTVIYQSSGHSLYDEKALEAIKLAGPFPPPSASIVTRVKEGDIILGFPI